MLVALDGEAFESLLINMTKPAGLVVRVISHRMGAANQFHKPALFTVEQGAKNEMKVVRH